MRNYKSKIVVVKDGVVSGTILSTMDSEEPATLLLRPLDFPIKRGDLWNGNDFLPDPDAKKKDAVKEEVRKVLQLLSQSETKESALSVIENAKASIGALEDFVTPEPIPELVKDTERVIAEAKKSIWKFWEK